MSLTVQLESRRAYVNSLAENTTRTARLALSYDSSGSGELIGKHPVSFQLTFTEQPTISTGVALRSGKIVPGKAPNVCAGVWHWQRDPKGMYIGAWLFFVVDSGGQGYALRHSVTFEGVAIKLYDAHFLRQF
jgi:hypothetical protein